MTHDHGRAGAAPEGGRAGTQVCVLLACFTGARRAAKIRRQLGKRITRHGDTILDQVILKVSARHKALVYDPRRTRLGVLTSALTWGIFGLLSGGLSGLGIWAIAGAVCGGLYAYYTEHLLTKDELRRIGGRLPANASAIIAFVRAADPRRVLSSAASCQPATASAAAIAGDLSAHVLAGASGPVETSSAPASGAPVPLAGTTMLNMLLLRYPGTDTARRTMARARSAHQQEPRPVQAELVFEAPEHGRLKVSDPTHGMAAMSRSDVISWGLFGLVYGAIVGVVAGSHGVLGHITSGVVTGIVWAAFGLVAGALYGLWAGRGVSARRLKGLGPVLPAAHPPCSRGPKGTCPSRPLMTGRHPARSGLSCVSTPPATASSSRSKTAMSAGSCRHHAGRRAAEAAGPPQILAAATHAGHSMSG